MPNFEEIWPSGKNKNKPSERPDPMDYVLEAMKLGIPGERNKDFTTVGKPRVRKFTVFENDFQVSFFIFRSQSISTIIQSNVTRKKLLKIWQIQVLGWKRRNRWLKSLLNRVVSVVRFRISFVQSQQNFFCDFVLARASHRASTNLSFLTFSILSDFVNFVQFSNFEFSSWSNFQFNQ